MATGSLIHMVAHYRSSAEQARKMGMADIAELAETVLRLIDRGIIRTRSQAIAYEEAEIAKMKRSK